jgi:hypothetical protein
MNPTKRTVAATALDVSPELPGILAIEPPKTTTAFSVASVRQFGGEDSAFDVGILGEQSHPAGRPGRIS